MTPEQKQQIISQTIAKSIVMGGVALLVRRAFHLTRMQTTAVFAVCWMLTPEVPER